MNSILEQIEYHRAAMIKQPYSSSAYFFHMRKAADWTAVWRQKHSLSAVQ